MSTIEVNKITPVSGGTAIQVGESGDTITIPSGATLTNSGTANNFTNYRPNAQPIIINGDMGVWQRSTSTVTMSDGYYNVDRYRGEEGTDGTATWSRSTSVPDDTGLAYSLQVDCTGTDSSIGSGQQTNIQQTIEAQNLQLLKWGTSDAEALTVAFWVKSNQTGQHSCSFRKLDNTAYNQPKTYNIDVADTWEKKVLTFSALTSSGGEIANDNGDGLQIFWKLAAGTSYQGTADTWTATNQGATAVSGDVNFMSSTSNNFFLTGVQIEVGSYTAATIPPFQHETYGDNLNRCQRYYMVYGNDDSTSGDRFGSGYTSSTTNFIGIISLPVPLRSDPSLSINNMRVATDAANTDITGLGLGGRQGNYVHTDNTTSGQTDNYPAMWRKESGAARLEFNSEL